MESLRSVPLKDFQCVDTRNVDEAREAIGRIFCPHFLVPEGRRDGSFHARHNVARQPGYSVNFVAYGAKVEIDPGELSRFYLLQIPLRGSAEVRCGQRLASVAPDLRASLLSPTLASRMSWSEGCEKLIVQLSRDSIESLFAMMTQRPVEPVEFDVAVELTSPVGQGILQHAALLLSAAQQGAALSDAYRTSLRDGLSTLLLTGLSHGGSARLAAPAADGGPRAVKRALQYVEAAYDQPLSVVDIAAASGVSLRALQEAFRKARGQTLWQAVQTIRLEKLRERLEKAGPETTVVDAVFACGLGHLGRAAGLYLERFGESPSQTLRRKRQA